MGIHPREGGSSFVPLSIELYLAKVTMGRVLTTYQKTCRIIDATSTRARRELMHPALAGSKRHGHNLPYLKTLYLSVRVCAVYQNEIRKREIAEDWG